MPVSVRRLALIALAILGFAGGARAADITFGSVVRQIYKNGELASTITTNDSYTVKPIEPSSTLIKPLPTVANYRWEKTVVVRDNGISQTTIGTYTSVPYSVNKETSANIYEKIYYIGNPITVNYDGNGATSGSTPSSSFTNDVPGTIANNGFKREFTVSYNANGGSVTPSSDKATATFAKWASSKDGADPTYTSGQTGVVNPGGSTGGEVTLYARWSDASVTLPTPTRTGGYTFNGWYTEQTGGTRVGGGGDSYGPVGENKTLYAQWSSNQYMFIIASGDGGSGGDSGVYTYSNSQQTKTINLPTFDEGHYISKWTASGYSGPVPTISDNVLTIPAGTSGNFTMTPTWLAVKASVSYENYGTFGPFHPTTMTYGEVMKVSKPTKDDKAFGGWQVTSGLNAETAKFSVDGGFTWEDISSDELKIGASCETLCLKNLTTVNNGSVTLYAYWGSIYKIETPVEPADAGTVTGGGPYASGTSIILEAIPNDGYSFEKWKEDSSTDAKRSITVSGNATYTACFTGKVYRVWFDPMEGGISGVGKFYVQLGKRYGYFRNLPEPIAPQGQKFDGWYTEDEGGQLITNDSVVTTAENHTLYARYKDLEHHYVRFDGNGATNENKMAVQEFVGAETSVLSKNIYGKVGYEFIGWATNTAAAAKLDYTYTDCQSVSFPEAKANETNVLYATWKVNQYPLTLTLGKGIKTIKYQIGNSVWIATNASAAVQVDFGADWKAYAIAKDGYEYSATSMDNPATGTMTDAGAAFAADAAPKTITVKYDGNGSTDGTMADSTFTYDAAGNLTSNRYVRAYPVTFDANLGSPIPGPATSVWAFVGWGSGIESPVVYADGEMVTNVCGSTGGNVTLYAQWSSDVESAKITLPSAPKRVGYEFLGWGKTEQTSEQEPDPSWKPGDKWVPTEYDIKQHLFAFYAYWKKIELGPLSAAVGLTNGVLCADADLPGKKALWVVSSDGTKEWISCVTDVTVTEGGALRLKVWGAGTLNYKWKVLREDWRSGPGSCILKVSVDEDDPTVLFEDSSISPEFSIDDWTVAPSVTIEGEEDEEHEIVWVFKGEITENDEIAFDEMTWTPSAPSPSPVIVTPGVETTYATKADAEAAAVKAQVVPPKAAGAAVISTNDYAALFQVRVAESSTVAGKWTLVPEFTTAASNELQTAVNAAANGLVAKMRTGEVLDVTMTTEPGLYYGIAAANELQNLATPSNWLLATKKSQELSVDRPSPDRGFFRVWVKAEDPSK